jgi:hypothetical protein
MLVFLRFKGIHAFTDYAESDENSDEQAKCRSGELRADCDEPYHKRSTAKENKPQVIGFSQCFTFSY